MGMIGETLDVLALRRIERRRRESGEPIRGEIAPLEAPKTSPESRVPGVIVAGATRTIDSGTTLF